MLKPALLLTSLLLVTLTTLLAADARDHLLPHQRVILESKSPPPAECRFGFDLPAGPQFTETQGELGQGVKSDLAEPLAP